MKKKEKKGGCLKTILTVFGVIIVIGIVGSAISGGSKDDDKANTKTESTADVASNKEDTADTAQQAETESKEDTSKEESKEEADVPTEYKSALKSAENYSDVMNMSKAAIYDQLTSEHGEKFTQEEADYAIANLN